jgi:hypothetical protein
MRVVLDSPKRKPSLLNPLFSEESERGSNLPSWFQLWKKDNNCFLAYEPLVMGSWSKLTINTKRCNNTFDMRTKWFEKLSFLMS